MVVGFQLLHAVHAVETFLYNLKQRGCNFHIVWYEDHNQLCLPTDTSVELADMYLLARAVIIRHLQRSLTGTPGSDQVNLFCFEFSDLQDPNFDTYLVDNAIHFFMCLNPVLSGDCSSSREEYLNVARHLGAKGYSLAFINTVDFVSSKVSSF